MLARRPEPLPPMTCRIDHLVVTAPDLETGVAHVRGALGAAPQSGGEHARLGTHNCVLRLGDSVYLEVIARNPRAPDPGRPRWFELDLLPPGAPPRLATWVARCDDIRAAGAASSEPLGEVEPMARNDLSWLITIPADGKLGLGGIAPALIQWHSQPHPASRMQQAGCSLLRLEAFHPEPERATTLLDSISFEGPLRVTAIPRGSRPFLVAHVQTPDGIRTI
jgi:Glyoxalase-like domain